MTKTHWLNQFIDFHIEFLDDSQKHNFKLNFKNVIDSFLICSAISFFYTFTLKIKGWKETGWRKVVFRVKRDVGQIVSLFFQVL